MISFNKTASKIGLSLFHYLPNYTLALMISLNVNVSYDSNIVRCRERLNNFKYHMCINTIRIFHKRFFALSRPFNAQFAKELKSTPCRFHLLRQSKYIFHRARTGYTPNQISSLIS